MTSQSPLLALLAACTLALQASGQDEPADPSAPQAAEGESGGDGAKPAEKPEDLQKATKEVSLKKELKVYEEVFRRRLALHFLHDDGDARDEITSGLDPESASDIKNVATDETFFKSLDYHYLEKMRNCEKRVLHRLRKDGFQGLEDLLEIVRDKKFPVSAAYATLLNTVEMNFRYALRKGLIQDEEFAKDAAARLTSEAVRINGTAGHDTAELAKEMYQEQKGDQFPAWWFDTSSGPLSYEFGEVPESPPYPMIDLNKATREELLGIPNVETEVADAIADYAKKNGFQGPEELRLVPEIPKHLVAPLQTLAIASHSVPKKQWSVLVYLNAANNLEPAGIEDVNEMEKIGSTRDVNIIVELARYRGRETKPETNGQYFSNPYAEREREFYLGLDNEPGAQRFYVLKDDDETRVQSVMKLNAGVTDAGHPDTLANFANWAVEHYPAEHYALVIWNHGAGWSGVSFDDNTHHGLDLPEVREALERTVPTLQKSGKSKFDILDFDACLMATLEVGYELKDVVDYLVASQEVEPGDGMPYDDYLKWIVTYPESQPVSFAKAMVETYVESYAPKGSQTNGDYSWLSETKSALRLSAVAGLREKVEALAGLLLTREKLLGDVTEELVGDARRFGRLVDIHDFVSKLKAKAKDDVELVAAAKSIVEAIGYPTAQYKLVNEVVIKRRQPGDVVWGINGWQSPPRNLAPFVHQSKHAKTPLTGPDERGNYVARLRFPPMVIDPKTRKPTFVKEINYRFGDEQEKRTVKDFENQFITTDFPADGVVVSEGHLVSNSRSHGVSLYFPAYLGFDKEYSKLRFAADSKWTALCEKFPLKKLEQPAPVAVLGINHATKADRDALGKLVVKDAFLERIRGYDFAAPYRADLKTLAKAFDVVPDPRPYGEDWTGMLKHWQDGIVILDNHAGLTERDANPFGFLSSESGAARPAAGPDGRTVMRFLKDGGRVLLSSPNATAQLWDTPLYRDTLQLSYGEKWDYDYSFRLHGEKIGADRAFELVPARKGQSIVTFTGGAGVEPLATLNSGERGMIGAKISGTDPATGKSFRAVVLGFFLTDVKGEENRRAILEEALAFLEGAGPDAKRPPIGLSTDAAASPATGASGGAK